MGKPKKTERTRKHGQLSVEFLLMFAVLLVILGVFIYISQTSETGVMQTKVRNEAQGTVDDLSAAAKEVYAQGKGAKKPVYITIPEGYEPENSYIGNRSIRIRVAGSDYAAVEQFEVRGTLPASEGSHYVWVISEGSSVRIGFAMFELERSAIAFSMEPGTKRHAQIIVRNIWPDEINLSIGRQWKNDTLLSVTPDMLSLKSGEEAVIRVDVSADEETAGMFAGSLHLQASDGKQEEFVSIPVTVIVAGQDLGGEAQGIFIVPDSVNSTMAPGSTLSRSFQVCTDAVTEAWDVSLTPGGDVGPWVSGLGPIAHIGQDSCVQKTINITSPAGADLGHHSGYVNITANSESALLNISLEIGWGESDVRGPVVDDIAVQGILIARAPISVSASAYENSSRVKECSASVDSGEWTHMEPLDGVFDSHNETVVFEIEDGLPAGNHSVSIMCVDSAGNIGKEYNHGFRLIREMLFVKLDGAMSESEREWSDWISIHHSNEGFAWDYDVVSSADLDMGMLEEYAAVVMADYIESETLNSKLQNHIDEGGYVVFLGEANEEGAYALCQTNEQSIAMPSSGARAVLTDHYITSPYSEGRIPIFHLDTKLYTIGEDYIGAVLLMVDENKPLTVLGAGNRIVGWGASRPFRLNEQGVDITTRTIDFAIMEGGKGKS